MSAQPVLERGDPGIDDRRLRLHRFGNDADLREVANKAVHAIDVIPDQRPALQSAVTVALMVRKPLHHLCIDIGQFDSRPYQPSREVSDRPRIECNGHRRAPEILEIIDEAPD
jgi:hypothetical protein